MAFCLDWRNPLSRIKASFAIQSQTVHFQYRVWFFAPMYLTMIYCLKKYRKRTIVLTIHNVVAHEASWWKAYMDKLVFRAADICIVHSRSHVDTVRHIA